MKLPDHEIKRLLEVMLCLLLTNGVATNMAFGIAMLQEGCTCMCNEPTPALFRSGCNGPEATIKSNSALSHILRRVVPG